jgi:hypothetical protein
MSLFNAPTVIEVSYSRAFPYTFSILPQTAQSLSMSLIKDKSRRTLTYLQDVLTHLVSIPLQPSFGLELMRLFSEYGPIKMYHRWVYTDTHLSGNTVSSDITALSGHITGKCKAHTGMNSHSFFDTSIEIR